MAALDPGTIAPDFTLPRDGGGDVTLSDLKGGPVVLFFYPKDNTPGCTKEAIAFTGLLEDFAASGATVLGISKDSVKKHDNFVAKHDLKVALLSDAEGDVCETYGVWGEKKMYGKTFEGITRTTVLIDAEGRVARVWPKVKVDGHAEEVLEAVRAL
ncbi:thioredoxin-dependent thiol peroxidase [Salibaculum griseiflavum]|uniref:thioredoxin-dependent peroxiredoxin n=1 Tax=Salibaculum griseiflavum TaxID=1914409 RepID=A0A2V1P6H0_9RHOB|nr:thioredoxin-dependent thiol peroxidase [Salibaculum griseiflavum]PWG18113.1 thioredoxin-dependent thiol peroxidase [Salibaculum griseiflavum]